MEVKACIKSDLWTTIKVVKEGRFFLILYVIILLLIRTTSVYAGDVTLSVAPQDIGFTMEITVSMVEVTATAVDRKGHTIHGLKKDDFTILENGSPQEIVRFANARGLPKRILVLLDVSGSMRIRNKIGVAKGAVEALINNLKPEDEISLLYFADGDVRRAVEYTKDRNQILDVMWELPAYGQTALRDAVEKAPFFATVEGNYQRALLLITDGVDNASTVTLDDAVRSARQVDLPIYTVGLDPSGGKVKTNGHDKVKAVTAMARLSDETGGRFSLVNNSARVRSALDQMIKDLENQYLIVFKSDFTQSSGEHQIEVKTKSRRYKVRARRGYFVNEKL
jgi:Ca-activated chloride channel homolog